MRITGGHAPVIGSASHLRPYSVRQLRSALWLLTTVHFLSKTSVGRFIFKTDLRVRRLFRMIVRVLQKVRLKLLQLKDWGLKTYWPLGGEPDGRFFIV